MHICHILQYFRVYIFTFYVPTKSFHEKRLVVWAMQKDKNWFVFVHRPKKILSFRETIQPHIDCRDVLPPFFISLHFDNSQSQTF
jgi:hypothetical protein